MFGLCVLLLLCSLCLFVCGCMCARPVFFSLGGCLLLCVVCMCVLGVGVSVVFCVVCVCCCCLVCFLVFDLLSSVCFLCVWMTVFVNQI